MLKRSHYYEDEHEEEESENWLASYSDLITDLLAVFVLLFAFALLTQGAGKASSGMMEGGPGVLDGGQSIVSEYPEKRNMMVEQLIKELKSQIKAAGLEGQVSVNKAGNNRIVMRMVDSVLFDTGKALIKEKVKPTLDGIAGILLEYDSVIKYIHIEGHTDDRPINTAQFPSNWELSTGRAGSVVRYLIDKSDITDEKFSSAGYGEFRPIADNATEEGKAVNRRVEFSVEVNTGGKKVPKNVRGD